MVKRNLKDYKATHPSLNPDHENINYQVVNSPNDLKIEVPYNMWSKFIIYPLMIFKSSYERKIRFKKYVKINFINVNFPFQCVKIFVLLHKMWNIRYIFIKNIKNP